MPEQRVIASTQVFHYTGEADYQEFKQFAEQVMYCYDTSLNSDGSATYYIGSGNYARVRTGEWVVPSIGPHPFEDNEFRQVCGPIPPWT